MRRIGTLEDASAGQRFVDYLTTRSIEASFEPDGLRCDIWIRDEQDVQRAKESLARFAANPSAEEFDVADEAGRLRRQRAAAEAKKIRQQAKLRRKIAASETPFGGGFSGGRAIPVTIGVIVIAVVVGFATGMGNPRITRDGQTFTSEAKLFFALSFVDRRVLAETGDGWASVKAGQLWRLVTPMFLHGGTFHLAFNMIMLYLLGSAVERIHGSLLFAGLLLVSQVAGMLLQASLPDWMPLGLRGAFNVVGASGAVYGVFGFLWVRPRFDPFYPIQIPPSSVSIMVGWLVLCMTPLIPGIANGAHLGGLVAGIAAAAWLPRRAT